MNDDPKQTQGVKTLGCIKFREKIGIGVIERAEFSLN